MTTAFASTYTVTVPTRATPLTTRLLRALQDSRIRSRQRVELAAALSGAYGTGTRDDVRAALARR